ncbi:MAG: ABC transporter permease [Bacteroidota bacterium]
MKGTFSKDLGGGWLRKGLVVFQFTMSIALISATWLVSKQIGYMSQQELGFEVDQIMTVNSPELTRFDSMFIERMQTFKAELKKSPQINHVTASSRLPGQRTGRIFQIRKVGTDDSEQTFTSNFIGADFDYAETYGLTPLAGRFLRRDDHNTEFRNLKNVAITAAMVKMLGFENNEKAVGQRLNFFGKDWTIVGVMPDFHQRSLHFGVKPLLFAPFYSTGNPLSLNITGKNVDETVAYTKSVYQKIFPGNTFQFAFLNADFQRLYEADQRFGNILSFFTLLTIFIACLGLFGLASYTTFLRTKEIGVRKILGASATNIITLLSKDFLKLVLVAMLLAAPIAWLTMDFWLKDFAYRIEVQWWIFAVAGIGAISIAFLTVSLQSVKAAFANPVKSLKSE